MTVINPSVVVVSRLKTRSPQAVLRKFGPFPENFRADPKNLFDLTQAEEYVNACTRGDAKQRLAQSPLQCGHQSDGYRFVKKGSDWVGVGGLRGRVRQQAHQNGGGYQVLRAFQYWVIP
jgi:hypothetical protein